MMTPKKLRIEPTIPNLLTLIRFLAIPFLAWAIYAGERYKMTAFIFFISIWSTDLLDGYIARHFNQTSDFGKIFDPFVDKVFQLTTAVMMFIIGRLPLWVPILIFIKEIMMVIGGFILYRRWKVIVHARWYGKLATVLFVLAFASLFFLSDSQAYLANYIFAVPVIWSLYAYVMYGLRFLWPLITKKKVKHG
jgi:cardiolipin synthase